MPCKLLDDWIMQERIEDMRKIINGLVVSSLALPLGKNCHTSGTAKRKRKDTSELTLEELYCMKNHVLLISDRATFINNNSTILYNWSLKRIGEIDHEINRKVNTGRTQSENDCSG